MSRLAKQCVYIYSGLGTTPTSLHMLTQSLRATLEGTTYTVRQMMQFLVPWGKWQENAAMLTIGGGFDKGVIKALGLEGLLLIKNYVHQGGSYLGICSGGYLACDAIEFDSAGPLEVCGERPLKFFPGEWRSDACLLTIGGGFGGGVIQALGSEGLVLVRDYVLGGGSYMGLGSGGYLGSANIEFDKGGEQEKCRESDFRFFPGTCIGPVLPGFKYNSEAGAYATATTWSWSLPETGSSQGLPEHLHCYFNGGGYFQSPGGATGDTGSHLVTDGAAYRVLATYSDEPRDKAAVVSCRVGKGMAVLSGVHFEFFHWDLDQSNSFLVERRVLAKMEASEQQRKTCFKQVLKMLGLRL